jgi:hypothetical protein
VVELLGLEFDQLQRTPGGCRRQNRQGEAHAA